jgi:hypothetical protein
MKTLKLSSILLSALLLVGCNGDTEKTDTEGQVIDLNQELGLDEGNLQNQQPPENGQPQPPVDGQQPPVNTVEEPLDNSESNTEPVSDVSQSSELDITNAILSNRSTNCADYVKHYISNVQDIQNETKFDGSLNIEVENGKCKFTANNIPNHDFNDFAASFASAVSAQNISVEMTSIPTLTGQTTQLDLGVDNAILLNGVKIDILPAACYNVGDEKIGCNDISTPWRFDPMSPLADFGTDSHNAHTQPDGSYHYHGSPKALFDTAGQAVSPVIGFAADGFPIYGTYIEENGQIRAVKPSYKLKDGSRVEISGANPGGTYDGTYRDDYEFVNGLGDLDECNGMSVDGNYGYYVTDGFPYVMACYKGTIDDSFKKQGGDTGGQQPQNGQQPPEQRQ